MLGSDQATEKPLVDPWFLHDIDHNNFTPTALVTTALTSLEVVNFLRVNVRLSPLPGPYHYSRCVHKRAHPSFYIYRAYYIKQ